MNEPTGSQSFDEGFETKGLKIFIKDLNKVNDLRNSDKLDFKLKLNLV